jgi:hypothetical protein
MPDRDQFRKLPRAWRPAARALLAVARGERSQVDLGAIDDGVLSDLGAGIPTLPATLKLFENFYEQPPLGAEMALDRLARATLGLPRDRNDSILHEEAEKMLVARQHSPPLLVQRVLERVHRHNVIDSKGGVAQVLRAEGRSVDARQLLQACAPLIESKARQMRQRPAFKRLRAESASHRRVDPNANLLGEW